MVKRPRGNGLGTGLQGWQTITFPFGGTGLDGLDGLPFVVTSVHLPIQTEKQSMWAALVVNTGSRLVPGTVAPSLFTE